MPNVPEAYCELADLRKGDIRLPPYMGDGTSYAQGAAREIDAALGHIYETPFIVEVPPSLMTRPAILLIRNINWLIASGRLILDLAAAGESAELHSYGKRMLDEGLLQLDKIASGKILLTGAPLLDDGDENDGPSGAFVLNEDTGSLVQGFYDMMNPKIPLPTYPVEAYGNVRLP